MKQLILAGDIYQYRLYLLKKKIEEDDAVFVAGRANLLGRDRNELANMITIGTWYKREYANIMPIRTHIKSRGIDFSLLATGML